MNLLQAALRGRLALQDRVQALKSSARVDSGATAVEYALMVGLIAVVIIVAVTLLGNRVSGVLNTAASAISS
jgi:pilus assembly protein Flp/PilA